MSYTNIAARTRRSLATINRYVSEVPIDGKGPVRGKATTPRPPPELDLSVKEAREATDRAAAVATADDLDPVDITSAPLNWQRHWFATPMHRREEIEEHLAHARIHLATLQRLDVTDPSQHTLWAQIRADSPYSVRDLGGAIGIPYNNITAYEKSRRKPVGGRVRTLYQAGLWNVIASEYHHHLLLMMWHCFWAERDQDAPATIKASNDFIEWAATLDEHPLFIDLQPGIAYNTNIGWPPSRSMRSRSDGA